MKKNILARKPISHINKSLYEGEISVVNIAEEVISNYESSNSSQNAFVEFNDERIIQSALKIDADLKDNKFSTLSGIPISVKDLYGVDSYKTRAGTPKELPKKWEAQGPIINILEQNNALFTGKTHTVEFAFGGVGINPHWGTPINPWDKKNHRAPGGSSAGAGVSLCSNTASIALGTDTAGSVRIPASVTGNVGLKTTKNRWSTDGIVPLSKSFDTPGILTNTVEDAIYTFEELDKTKHCHAKTKDDVINKDIKFTVATYDWFFEKCEDGIDREILQIIKKIESKNKVINIKSIDEIDESYHLFTKGGLAAAEFASFINGEMIQMKDSLDPNVSFRIKDLHSFSAIEYLQRKDRLENISLSIQAKFDEFDIILTPTVPISPPEVRELINPKKYSEANGLMLRNTSPINLLGLSAITIPVALDNNNMPIGLQLIAPAYSEVKLLSVASAIESLIGNKYENLL
jgi:aspartyl-tRNA(Asn)/glutamyl-tRNA(Gln) amidotransferase subunit A